MKYIKVILIFLFLSSCSANKKVVGLYGKCEKNYFDCSQVLLKSDKTFEYYNSNESGKEKITRGTWTNISVDTLKLIITKKNKSPEITNQITLDSINPSDIIITQIPYLSNGKVLIGKGNLTFNSSKGWTRFVLKKTRMKNKRWN